VSDAPLAHPSAFDLPHLLALKDAVVPTAVAAGRWARALAARFEAGEDVLDVRAKTAPGDLVTFGDAEVQRRLVAALQPLAPGVGFLGEEEGLDERATDAPTWVIDPIDGTHNFVRGAGPFCVSVGLVVDGVSVLGVIYDAGEDATYWAVCGGGAWRVREGEAPQRLRGPAPRDLAHALVATNFTAESARSSRDGATFMAIAAATAGVRSSGAACHDFCRFAAGRIDLFWQVGLKAWDVAAGAALVREAGGACTFADAPADWLRAPGLAVFAGQPGLVDAAIAAWRGAPG
jgi:myo-inositol-1(or 4)-monophosphatase